MGEMIGCDAGAGEAATIYNSETMTWLPSKTEAKGHFFSTLRFGHGGYSVRGYARLVLFIARALSSDLYCS